MRYEIEFTFQVHISYITDFGHKSKYKNLAPLSINECGNLGDGVATILSQQNLLVLGARHFRVFSA